MRFKLDENMPREIADLLRSAGHDAATVLEQDLGGQPDTVLASIVQRETRILATLDRDSADIRRFPPDQYPGLLVFRVTKQEPGHLAMIWRQLLSVLETGSPAGELWVVEENAVRRRLA